MCTKGERKICLNKELFSVHCIRLINLCSALPQDSWCVPWWNTKDFSWEQLSYSSHEFNLTNRYFQNEWNKGDGLTPIWMNKWMNEKLNKQYDNQLCMYFNNSDYFQVSGNFISFESFAFPFQLSHSIAIPSHQITLSHSHIVIHSHPQDTHFDIPAD